MKTLIKRCPACGQHNAKIYDKCVRCGTALPEKVELIEQDEANIAPPPSVAPTIDESSASRPWPWQNMSVEVEGQPLRVVVTDFDMSFWHMVMFMVKWVIASIPALLILFLYILFAMAVLGALGALMH